jgi:hydrogenase/urease accessory protein HupE
MFSYDVRKLTRKQRAVAAVLGFLGMWLGGSGGSAAVYYRRPDLAFIGFGVFLVALGVTGLVLGRARDQ